MPVPKKGVNPHSGGLSKASLDALSPEIRAKYQDNGLLLDGSIDNSPLDSQSSTSQEQSAEPTIPLSQVEQMLEKMLAEKLGSAKKDEPAKPDYPFIKNDVADSIPELEPWEYKDRVYVMIDGSKPISQYIRHKPTKLSPLQYTDKKTLIVHSLRYASNQPSIFMDKQTGDVMPSHIVMKSGVLQVPKENVNLQKFLAIHPDNGIIFKELDVMAEAKKAYDAEEVRFKAEKLAREIDSASQSAVARIMCRDFKEDWDGFTLKNRIFAEAKNRPIEFIKIANDRSLMMKGVIKTGLYMGYITYGNYKFTDDTGNVFLTVAPEQDEIQAVAEYFQSNAGKSLYDWLEQKVK
jgi:hypothetical protein